MKLKLLVIILCFTFVIAFGMTGSKVFAACPDGSGNCDITGEFQINSSRALKMSTSITGNPPTPVLRDIFIGENAGALNPNADGRAYGNVFVGRNTGSSLEKGAVNTFIGDRVAENLKYGLHNTYIGGGVGGVATFNPNDQSEYSPSYNTIVGSIAGGQNLGSGNVFFGTEAGRYNTIGSENIGLGIAALANYGDPYNLCSDPQGCVSRTGNGNVHVGIYTGTSSPDLFSTLALGYTPLATSNNQMVVGSHVPHIFQKYEVIDCGETDPAYCTVGSIGYHAPSTCVEGELVTSGSGMVTQTLECIGYLGLIKESYWGSGVVSTDPQDFSFNASGGHGTDVSGAGLIVAGGKSTGSANGGSIKFQTSPKGTTSGSNQNSLVDRMIIDSEGRIGIGTNPNGLSQINIDATDRVRALRINNNVSNGGTSYGVYSNVDRTDTSTINGEVVGYANTLFLKNSGDLSSSSFVYPLSSTVVYQSGTGGTSNVNSPLFTTAYFSQGTGPGNVRNFNILNPASSVESWGVDTSQGTGSITYSDFRHVWLKDSTSGTLTKQTGLWIDEQTQGTDNYGIVLNGDGAGSDIAFGPNQESSIYSNAGELFAEDGVGNVTQISPHDAETGEWIFYSKNTKTGRTVRVNMEELVKDMEKLTGKKYLIESFIETPR